MDYQVIYIRKAFDTMSWNFILKILEAYNLPPPSKKKMDLSNKLVLLQYGIQPHL